MMYWWGQHMGGWGYALMSISVVLFWGVVILGVVALVRYLVRSSQPVDSAHVRRLSAEELLAERFARGEIDEQEYQSRMAALRDMPQPMNGGERRP